MLTSTLLRISLIGATVCIPTLDLIGQCTNDGSSIGIGFEDTFGGGDSGMGTGQPGNRGFWHGETDEWFAAPPTGGADEPTLRLMNCYGFHLGWVESCEDEVEVPEDVEASDDAGQHSRMITISDLAEFAPTPPQISVDPAGVAVMNLPANFVSDATEQVVDATILGRAVTVRFTPVYFAFDTGDGTVLSSETGGVSWADAGQEQFTETPTSHIYRDRGVFYPSVTVTYDASVDVGTGWISLGAVAAQGPATELRVYEAVTRLVKNAP